MFDSALIYLAQFFSTSHFREGQFVESPEIWSGHLGGIEGLRQKGRTVWTVCLLLLLAEKITGKLEIMGQGDNQVIKITYRSHLSPEEINNAHRSFLRRLDGILKKVGPPLKLEDTWTSSGTYVYGKCVIHNGVPLSMSMKKIARLFHLSNNMFLTLESTLSSLSAIFIAACSSDLSPLIPFCIYGIEVLSSVYHITRSVYLHETPLAIHYQDRGIRYSIPLS